MKKVILMTIVLMVSIVTVGAQNRPRNGFTSEQGIEKQLERLDKQLNLTGEQEKKIKALYEDFFKNSKSSRKERLNKKKALDESIEALLTDEQKKVFAKMKKNKQHRV